MKTYERLKDFEINTQGRCFSDFVLYKGIGLEIYHVHFNEREKDKSYLIVFHKTEEHIVITKFAELRKGHHHYLLQFKGKKGEKMPILEGQWNEMLVDIMQGCIKKTKKKRMMFLFLPIIIKHPFD